MRTAIAVLKLVCAYGHPDSASCQLYSDRRLILPVTSRVILNCNCHQQVEGHVRAEFSSAHAYFLNGDIVAAATMRCENCLRYPIAGGDRLLELVIQ